MIKRSFYLLTILLFLLSSCSSSDKNNSDDKNLTLKVNDVSFTMVYVEGGTFTMGAIDKWKDEAFKNEFPCHEVTLSDYYIGQTEVTQALWTAVMGTSIEDCRVQSKKYWDSIDEDISCSLVQHLYGEGPDFPVYYVSWYQCIEFCYRLSELTGHHFTLPTEAQWEYAARGGKQSQSYLYSGSDTFEEVGFGNLELIEEGSNVKVATLKANELGLYDMSGGVNEWCIDAFKPYSPDKVQNPVSKFNPNDSIKFVVARGGGWFFPHVRCRTTYRDEMEPGDSDMALGFRIVMID